MMDEFDEWDEADDEDGGQQAMDLARSLVAQFGAEGPLRAELMAATAMKTGDKPAYRLFKMAESLAEEILLLKVSAGHQ